MSATQEKSGAQVRWTRVRWTDSCMIYEQLAPHEFPTPLVIDSVGIIVAEGDDYLTIARDHHQDGNCRGVISIPKIAILARLDEEGYV